jgi:hypothetical protein
MPYSSAPIVPRLRTAADTARICPLEQLARGRRAENPKAPPNTALTSATEWLHGDKSAASTDFLMMVARQPPFVTHEDGHEW